MAGFSISQQDHEAITERRSILARQITAAPGDRQRIGVELAKLVAAFPTQDPGMTAPLRIEAYSDALGDAPAWAVREARLKIVRGEIGDLDKRFAPTPPQLAEIIATILRPFRNDLADLAELERIAPTHEPTAEERARIRAGFDGLLGELGKEPASATHARAVSALEARAVALGLDQSAIDALPDAPPRQGAFGKLG